MANNSGDGGASDDFLEQILGFPAYAGPDSNLTGNEASMMLQLNSGDGSDQLGGGAVCDGGGAYEFPLGLSLDQGKSCEYYNEEASASANVKRFRSVDHIVDSRVSSSVTSGFHGQSIQNAVPAVSHPPAIRQRVRAKRGQATDPHSIAERLRRERIAERIRALQELVPSVNKTDRAAMLDEIVEYVKFLKLQVKVLSMSRLGGAGAVAPLVTDIPAVSVEEQGTEGGRNEPALEKCSNDGTERQVAKLMDEDVGAAMQFLQSKALCIMPISLAKAIYHTQSPDSNTTTHVKPETNTPL